MQSHAGGGRCRGQRRRCVRGDRRRSGRRKPRRRGEDPRREAEHAVVTARLAAGVVVLARRVLRGLVMPVRRGMIPGLPPRGSGEPVSLTRVMLDRRARQRSTEEQRENAQGSLHPDLSTARQATKHAAGFATAPPNMQLGLGRVSKPASNAINRRRPRRRAPPRRLSGRISGSASATRRTIGLSFQRVHWMARPPETLDQTRSPSRRLGESADDGGAPLGDPRGRAHALARGPVCHGRAMRRIRRARLAQCYRGEKEAPRCAPFTCACSSPRPGALCAPLVPRGLLPRGSSGESSAPGGIRTRPILLVS